MRSVTRWPPVLAVVALSCAGATPSSPKQATTEPTLARPSVLAGVTATQPSPTTGRMAHIPEATYRMGSEVGESDERPVHEVHVSAFEMDVTEVTVAEYGQCVRAGGCVHAPTAIEFPGASAIDHQLFDSGCNDDGPERQDQPENCVDFAIADAYCHWAGKRLPTEQEWEYAACGGNCDQALAARGGAVAILGDDHWPFATRVAKGSLGPFGLYDMADNVWEWTASPYCSYERQDCGDSRRVIRGGSWSFGDFLKVRLTDRSPSAPSTRNPNLGFRCARTASP